MFSSLPPRPPKEVDTQTIGLIETLDHTQKKTLNALVQSVLSSQQENQ